MYETLRRNKMTTEDIMQKMHELHQDLAILDDSYDSITQKMQDLNTSVQLDFDKVLAMIKGTQFGGAERSQADKDEDCRSHRFSGSNRGSGSSQRAPRRSGSERSLSASLTRRVNGSGNSVRNERPASGKRDGSGSTGAAPTPALKARPTSPTRLSFWTSKPRPASPLIPCSGVRPLSANPQQSSLSRLRVESEPKQRKSLSVRSLSSSAGAKSWDHAMEDTVATDKRSTTKEGVNLGPADRLAIMRKLNS